HPAWTSGTSCGTPRCCRRPNWCGCRSSAPGPDRAPFPRNTSSQRAFELFRPALCPRGAVRGKRRHGTSLLVRVLLLFDLGALLLFDFGMLAHAARDGAEGDSGDRGGITIVAARRHPHVARIGADAVGDVEPHPAEALDPGFGPGMGRFLFYPV